MEITFTKTRSELQKERLRFALFVAISLHAIIVFGIGFNVLKPHIRAQTIEVTLAVHPDKELPDNADFIAQANQLGSGSKDYVDELTTDIAADQTSEDISQKFEVSKPTSFQDMQPIITSQGPTATAKETPDRNDLQPEVLPQDNANNPIQNLESLQARLAQQRNEYSKIPRTRRLTSVSTKSSDEAAYLAYWIERAERIGNENYPEEARRKKIYGELQLAVTLLPDGSVEGIEVIKSSGHRVLDLAAMRTVRLAAPFAPFNDSMREYDRYEIIRTWRYEPSRGLTTAWN